MVKARFEVLCCDEDDKGACARLKALMHDCKVSDAEPTAGHDHVGERDFGDEDEAIARMVGLNRLAGEDALEISVRIKRHGRGKCPAGCPSWSSIQLTPGSGA